MGSIQERINSAEVWHDWYADMLWDFVSDAATRGIHIETEQLRRGNNGPAISFRGFWSQGDGLAFDSTIDWPVFFEANPSFKNQHTSAYLLLVANPKLANMRTVRTGRDGVSMDTEFECDFYDDEVIESGFFEGSTVGYVVNEIEFDKVGDYIKSICYSEAGSMYNKLEAEYEFQIEDAQQQVREQIVEELRDDLKLILTELAQCELFKRQAVHDDIEWSDLDELKLIDHSRGGYWYITDAGWEVLEWTQEQ